MKFTTTTVLAVLVWVDLSVGKPYTHDAAEAFELGSKTELRHQRVSYTLGRINDESEGNVARFDYEEDGKEDGVEDDEGLELQRATTFTSPVVPMEFRDTIRKKPKKKNLNKKKLLKKMGADFNPEWMALEKPQMKPVESNEDDDDSDSNNFDMQVSGLLLSIFFFKNQILQIIIVALVCKMGWMDTFNIERNPGSD